MNTVEYTQTQTHTHVYIYIYIYKRVCVWFGSSPSFKHVLLNNKDTFCLYNFIRVISDSFLTSVLVLGWSWLMNLLKLSRALSDPS